MNSPLARCQDDKTSDWRLGLYPWQEIEYYNIVAFLVHCGVFAGHMGRLRSIKGAFARCLQRIYGLFTVYKCLCGGLGYVNVYRASTGCLRPSKGLFTGLLMVKIFIFQF